MLPLLLAGGGDEELGGDAAQAQVYVMTEGHRTAVLAIAPEAASKIICLDPDGDIPNPHGKPPAAYQECAIHLRHAITVRLTPATTASSVQG